MRAWFRCCVCAVLAGISFFVTARPSHPPRPVAARRNATHLHLPRVVAMESPPAIGQPTTGPIVCPNGPAPIVQRARERTRARHLHSSDPHRPYNELPILTPGARSRFDKTLSTVGVAPALIAHNHNRYYYMLPIPRTYTLLRAGVLPTALFHASGPRLWR
jgi:hypothetical protein